MGWVAAYIDSFRSSAGAYEPSVKSNPLDPRYVDALSGTVEIGSVVCKNFYANGNVHWHYDRLLDNVGDAVDYRVISYVEDTR